MGPLTAIDAEFAPCVCPATAPRMIVARKPARRLSRRKRLPEIWQLGCCSLTIAIQYRPHCHPRPPGYKWSHDVRTHGRDTFVAEVYIKACR